MFIQFTALGFEPLKHESPPITTSPGLPPTLRLLVVIFKIFRKKLRKAAAVARASALGASAASSPASSQS